MVVIRGLGGACITFLSLCFLSATDMTSVVVQPIVNGGLPYMRFWSALIKESTLCYVVLIKADRVAEEALSPPNISQLAVIHSKCPHHLNMTTSK